jgi:anaerobic ribonucleoside-triphosphate reductase activating protein
MPINHILTLIKEDELANVTFSGGDPFYQVDAATELAKRIKAETDKTIWCYTGFTIEEIREDPNLSKLLPYIDVLVDGPYVESLRNTDLPFRGSENQRIIYINDEKSN